MSDADAFSPPDIIEPVPEPSRRARLFGPGSPLFNVTLMVALAGVSAFIVTSPTADDLREGAESVLNEAGDVVVGALRPEWSRVERNGSDGSGDDDKGAGTADDGDGEAGRPDRVELTAYRGAERSGPGADGTPSSSARSSSSTSGSDRSGAAGSGTTTSKASSPTSEATSASTSTPPPTAPPSTTTTIPAPPVPTVAEILSGRQRFFGLHAREAPYWMKEVDEVSTLVGKTPSLLLFFTPFSRDYPGAAVNNSWENGQLPMVSWEPIIENSTTGQPTLADIHEGRHDAYIDRWAADAAAHGAPFALRFAHEMNGDWYPWSEQTNGNKPGDFAKAWRHLHDRFEAAGADNVIWVWSVNRIEWLPHAPIEGLYPGDEYVDWVGVAGYYREEVRGQAPSFSATFDNTLAALRRVAPRKPILLSEVGAGTSEGNRVAWIDDLFAQMPAHPDIIGFTWFNDVKSGGDWRIQYSGPTTEAFARGVADGRYAAGRPRTPPPVPGS